MENDKFSSSTAMAVVIANMIGTGVFTSLGFQLMEIQSVFVIVALWLVGGISALCGALSYAELGAALPRSGGEYHFLSHIYHPSIGFVSGWLSATIGFAAPTALAAITFGSYVNSVFPGLSPTWLAATLVVALTLLHSRNRSGSGRTQRWFTWLKLLLIVGFCGACMSFAREPQAISLLPQSGDRAMLFSSAFAVSLIYVNYAYTGWNAATYLSSELQDPQRNLPRVLGAGTAIVVVAYLCLNLAFLYVSPMEQLAGRVEVGFVAAQSAFGNAGGRVMGLVLAMLLISTASAMILAGPRVLQTIGEDFSALRWLGRTNAGGVPHLAILSQSAVSLLFIFTGSFQAILVFAGFTLGCSTLVTVLGVFVLRWHEPDRPRPYRVWLYPLPPIVYCLIMTWTLAYIAMERPTEAGWGLALFAAGFVFYALTRQMGAPPASRPTG